jgi:hypothetical protein
MNDVIVFGGLYIPNSDLVERFMNSQELNRSFAVLTEKDVLHYLTYEQQEKL